MPITIDDHVFTGFFGHGFDANHLRALSHGGRVEWLRFRFGLVFMTPFRKFVALDSPDCYVWLCVTSLLCAAIEALAAFEFPERNGAVRFSRFVEKYFSVAWQVPIQLDDLDTSRNPATNPAQHLYKYFRCGLAHSFAIEWGGIRHREDGAPDYLFARDAAGRKSLGIVPSELVQDFDEATEKVLW